MKRDLFLRHMCAAALALGALGLACGDSATSVQDGGPSASDPRVATDGATSVQDGGPSASDPRVATDGATSVQDGGASKADTRVAPEGDNGAPGEATSAGCRSTPTSVSAAFPGAQVLRVSHGSGFLPELKGGTLVDGTYLLVERLMRGSGSLPSRAAAVLVIKGAQVEYFESHISESAPGGYAESAAAGPVVSKGTYLDASGMKQCWGSESLSTSVAYSATSTEICLRMGVVDYTFRKQEPLPL